MRTMRKVMLLVLLLVLAIPVAASAADDFSSSRWVYGLSGVGDVASTVYFRINGGCETGFPIKTKIFQNPGALLAYHGAMTIIMPTVEKWVGKLTGWLGRKIGWRWLERNGRNIFKVGYGAEYGYLTVHNVRVGNTSKKMEGVWCQ